jgi:hypothetical protein
MSVVDRYGRERRRFLEQAPALENALQSAERLRLLKELERLERRADAGTAVPVGGPLVWAHVEALRALKKGGHMDRWDANPSEESHQPDPTTGS